MARFDVLLRRAVDADRAGIAAPMPGVDADERRTSPVGAVVRRDDVDDDPVALVPGGRQRHHPEVLVAGQVERDANGAGIVALTWQAVTTCDLERIDGLGQRAADGAAGVVDVESAVGGDAQR